MNDCICYFAKLGVPHTDAGCLRRCGEKYLDLREEVTGGRMKFYDYERHRILCSSNVLIS